MTLGFRVEMACQHALAVPLSLSHIQSFELIIELNEEI